ncbi:Sigma-K factor [Ruegeria sp. THAF57]|uniref:RNA polymerase sigma factor n=1 Tax=unclassified Ruegeria TaxID=2625375 RepID=UPI0014896999|nr:MULTISPECIES: sigma-70 family RNA polymerase sigma factor [unclassified Ruegeria]CAD0186759.1 Sigma-K factor [Ruegeria sp. THAF57]
MNNAQLNALLQAVAGGDKTALAGLYRALEKPVYRFIASKMNDPFEAGDILHEVFMEVWRSAGKFEGRSAVKTWVFGIAYRKTMDHFRKHKRISPSDDLPEQVDEGPDAVACLAAAQEAEHLRFCLEGLKADHRSAIELAFYEDMSYGEISRVVDAPENTIKTRIFHAKKLLLRCLSGRMKEAAT